MQLRKKGKRSLILNVTSLIDVLFLLLIFFMISTTFLSTPAIKLELPDAAHADPVRHEPLIVYVDENGSVFLNDDPTDLSLLDAGLRAKLQDREEKAVVLKIDSQVSHGHVVRVMDTVKGAGVTRLVIATDPKE